MSQINNNQIPDTDIESGYVGLSSDGVHLFDEKTPSQVYEKYFFKFSPKKSGKAETKYYDLKSYKLEKGKIISIPGVRIEIRGMFKYPEVPYVKNINIGGKIIDVGPKKPQLNFSVSEKNSIMGLLKHLDFCTKIAYIYRETKIDEISNNADEENPAYFSFFPKIYSGSYFEDGDEDEEKKGDFRHIVLLKETGEFVSIKDFVKGPGASVKTVLTNFIEDITIPPENSTEGSPNKKNVIIKVPREEFQPKIAKEAMWFEANFRIPLGKKTRKITATATSAVTTDEELAAMQTDKHWNMHVNIAVKIKDTNEIKIIQNPLTKQNMNWFKEGREREGALWESFVKSYPDMENLPMPEVIKDERTNKKFTGRVFVSFSDLGYGSGKSKTHHQLDQVDILPVGGAANKTATMGKTASFQMGNENLFANSTDDDSVEVKEGED